MTAMLVLWSVCFSLPILLCMLLVGRSLKLKANYHWYLPIVSGKEGERFKGWDLLGVFLDIYDYPVAELAYCMPCYSSFISQFLYKFVSSLIHWVCCNRNEPWWCVQPRRPLSHTVKGDVFFLKSYSAFGVYDSFYYLYSRSLSLRI